MVDINKTIYTNIVNKINMLRYQAVDDPTAFRAILDLIIVDCLIRWAGGLDEPQHILDQLVEKRNAILMHNSCIIPEYTDWSTAYVNVNTPQTNDDWKRVWDAAESDDYIFVNTVLTPANPEPEEDFSCVRWGGIKDLK
jgi:hypothetical protein